MIKLPSDPASERAFVASMILTQDKDILRKIVDSVKPAGRAVFHDPYHATLYDGVAACWKEHGKCDAILLRVWLVQSGKWDSTPSPDGPLADLVAVLNSVPDIHHGAAYGAVLLHLWRSREAYCHALKLAKLAAKAAPVSEQREALAELSQIFAE